MILAGTVTCSTPEEHRTAVRTKVTMLEFYSYCLALCSKFSSIHHGGKLLQQYIVDAYVKVEGSNLDRIRHNQAKLQVEKFCGLIDYLNNQTAQLNVNPGRIVILTSTFQVCLCYFW